jgi:hypothetical protein
MVTSRQERCQWWLVITIDTQTFTTTKTPSQNCYYFGKGPYEDNEGYSKGASKLKIPNIHIYKDQTTHNVRFALKHLHAQMMLNKKVFLKKPLIRLTCKYTSLNKNGRNI